MASTELRFHCQSCQAKLVIVTDDLSERTLPGGPSEVATEGSVGPPDDRPADAPPTAAALEESWVTLRHAVDSSTTASSAPLPGISGGGTSSQGGDAGEPLGGHNFNARIRALDRVFEMVSDCTYVDHPLCSDCSNSLNEELDAQVVEIEQEIAAYQQAIHKLESEEEADAEADEGQLAKEMAEVEAQHAVEAERTEMLEAELSRARSALWRLEAKSAELDELEESYWHEFNDFSGHLQGFLDERAQLLRRLERASTQLDTLRGMDVYNDVFQIWHEGPFGTISGFRLGRSSEVHVEWDEINAAWGQAVLLLHALAGAAEVTFPNYRLLPMGSQPAIADASAVYSLWGPPGTAKLFSGAYDKGMVCFLACIKAFEAHARAADEAARAPQPFELPYGIDGDRVGGLSIRLHFNRDAKWTQALKLMLTDLKWLLKWTSEHAAQRSRR